MQYAVDSKICYICSLQLLERFLSLCVVQLFWY